MKNASDVQESKDLEIKRLKASILGLENDFEEQARQNRASRDLNHERIKELEKTHSDLQDSKDLEIKGLKEKLENGRVLGEDLEIEELKEKLESERCYVIEREPCTSYNIRIGGWHVMKMMYGTLYDNRHNKLGTYQRRGNVVIVFCRDELITDSPCTLIKGN